MNRALCLTSVDTDSTESKIDELLNRVTSIALKQKEEVRVKLKCKISLLLFLLRVSVSLMPHSFEI